MSINTVARLPSPITRNRHAETCAGMADMYQERLKVGKNTTMGKAAKLVYNISLREIRTAHWIAAMGIQHLRIANHVRM